jgi:hypothetical protein
MSWSFHNRLPMRRHPSRVVAVVFVTSAMVSVPVFAAQIFVQPVVTLSAENDSNLDLDPGRNPQVQGYLASVGALTGIVTQNSDSEIWTRLDYRDYPKDRSDDRLEEYLNFRSDYNTQLSRFNFSGVIDRRDEFNAEFSSALYDEINPVLPTNPSTGKVVNGGTVTSVLLLPSYSYKISPLWGVGVSGIYQNVQYTPSIADLEDFNYYQGKAHLDWNFTQRTQLSFGAYSSKYEATKIDSNATGSGVSADMDTSWTPLLSTSASVLYQHTTIDMTYPSYLNTDVNTWGGTIGASYKTQTTQYRLNVGRILTPTGGGGVYANEQAQFQYNRNFTQRWQFIGAAIYIRSSQLPAATNEDNRSYLQTTVDLKWLIRPTWFLQAGYAYTWQKFEQSPDGAANNRIYIRVGYQGLGPQR